MSMFGMVFGDPSASYADHLLAAVGLTKGGVGRFRSVWLEMCDDKPVIAVYTRNGGGNREHYNWDSDKPNSAGDSCFCTGCTITHHLPKNKYYIGDEDDSFDCTYATVRFRLPDELVKLLDETDKDWRSKVQQKVDRGDRCGDGRRTMTNQPRYLGEPHK